MNLTTIFLSTAQLTTFDFHRADMNNTLSVNTLSTTRNMAIIKNGRIINPPTILLNILQRIAVFIENIVIFAL